ncbi:MAG: hypothetical protein U0414_39870 [Polyangiaceae bacterium]
MFPCANCGWMLQDNDPACNMCGSPTGRGLAPPTYVSATSAAAAPPPRAPAPALPSAKMEKLFEDAAAELGEDCIVGKSFLYLKATAFDRPSTRWVKGLLGGKSEPRVVPIVGGEPLVFGGVKVTPLALPALDFFSITTDKALYREGADDVSVLVVDPLRPSSTALLVVRLNGTDLLSRGVTLDENGAGTTALRGLGAGAYEVTIYGAQDKSPATFTVAAYRLAPLVMALSRREMIGDELDVGLSLTSFGAPFAGRIRLDLTEKDRVLETHHVVATDGKARARFRLTGQGPHAINAQSEEDPGKTATTPIVGSRADERSQTTLSKLGVEVTGSLLPGPGERSVRGIFLKEGAMHAAPIGLERVDAKCARLVARTAIDRIAVLVRDPAVPARRSNAVDVAKAQHPSLTNERYKHAEKLFHEGKYAVARSILEEAVRPMKEPPHPFFAYCIACCHARLGDADKAIGALRTAIADGWTDLELLQKDADLAALHGLPAFESIARGGAVLVERSGLLAGEVVEIPIDGPFAVLLLGAFIDGKPWEGSCAVVTPSTATATASIEGTPRPGASARVAVDAPTGASTYVIVKDARLLSTDTPESRLASRIKAYVEETNKETFTGHPTRKLSEAPDVRRFGGRSTGIPAPLLPEAFGAAGMPMMMPSAPALGGGSPGSASLGYGGPRPPPMMRAPLAFEPPGMGPPGMGPPGMGPPGMGPPPASLAEAYGSAMPAGPPAAASPYRSPGERAAPIAPAMIREPEVLYAGFVPSGSSGVFVDLADQPADYVVETFTIRGVDWAHAETRFRADADTTAAVMLPAFVAAGDGAEGRIHVRSKRGGTLRVARDGAPVALRGVERGVLAAGAHEVSFVAEAGDYAITFDAVDTESVRLDRRVDRLGALRRMARSILLLEPGQAIDGGRDASVFALRVLPGLDKPMALALDATADYGHACCEQTAAKILAACAMYALAADPARRSKAESIIAAGIRRERTMYMKGRGFRMYPESGDSVSEYWSPKASAHLRHLASLKDLTGPAAIGMTLAALVDEGLAMAADVGQAHRLPWPPTRGRSAAELYAELRFGATPDVARVVGDAVAIVEVATGSGRVAARTEQAYGAATLFHAARRGAGGAEARRRAIDWTNTVCKDITPEGRLYSTVDSVALLALFGELSAARVVGGDKVEINGAVQSIEKAMRAEDLHVVRAVDSTVAVEVSRFVEDDWDQLKSDVAMSVALRDASGQVVRAARPGDALTLEVTLTGGYKAGDLAWVCLPDALSRVVGGGQVKRFSVDFEGKTTVNVPLAATGVTVGPSGAPAAGHYRVVVRNMFEEERAGNPGLLEIRIG